LATDLNSVLDDLTVGLSAHTPPQLNIDWDSSTSSYYLPSGESGSTVIG
jgi:hypothetical protein